MAVTSVKILHSGWSGTETAGSGITFNVVYQVEVDDRNDGPLTIINADDGTNRIPMPNESYNVGNEVDAFAFVKSVSPAPVSEKVWNVTVTYGPLEPPESPDGPNGQEPDGLDPEDKPTDDPTDEYVKIKISSMLASRAATWGGYLGKRTFEVENEQGEFEAKPIKGSKPKVGSHIAAGIHFCELMDGVPITNSVFTPFDPPYEVDYSRLRLTISMNLAVAVPKEWLYYINTVNSEPIDIIEDHTKSVIVHIPAYMGRCMGFSYDRRIKNGNLFWAVDIEILIDPLFGWRPEFLDKGYCEDSNLLTSTGATQKNNIKDADGVPLAEPVLLDGHGQQLDLETFDAVYLAYAVYPELDWNRWIPAGNPEKMKRAFLGIVE